MIPKRERARNREQTYFVTSSTWERRHLFRTQTLAELFVVVLGQYRGSSYLLHEFVLMPDHFHLLITPGEALERAVQKIKGGFSFRVKKELGSNSEIWQRGFSDHRIRDWEDYPLMTGLRTIAQSHDGDFRLTANQNLILGNVSAENRSRIEQLVQSYKLSDGERVSALRRNAMACVSLPTCGLAMAESERYLPSLITKLEGLLAEAGLANDEIVIRMTGCPNGCGQHWIADIGIEGKALGKYNLYLGADFAGMRLNRLYRENIGEEEILATLKPIIGRYARERQADEHFGDFVVRAGYVRAVAGGPDFHAQG